MDGPQAAKPAASTDGAAVTTENLGLRGPRGWAFRGVTLDAPAGSLIALEGPSGSGRTCLLLALTGRMRTTEGTARIAGLRLPKQPAALRRISALGHTPGVAELEPALTVAEHLRERALLQRRFGGSLRGLLRPRSERRAEARQRVDEALAAAGLDPATLPKGLRTAVRDLERTEALRLSIALALIGRPRLLGVDDTDLKLSDAERAEIWELLAALAGQGLTVLAVCSEAPAGALVVSTAPRQESGRSTAPEDGTRRAPDGGTQADARPEDDSSTTGTTGKENGDALAETGRA
ncbi:ATP-binding cassette domain-containing protein [Streptomyces physcomitrii]|uniref:ATP-binding cassette domain-containing protein n=1 Tax=Streptomyces physcomitrii TaxID=2724184 RepID=UPI003F4CC227